MDRQLSLIRRIRKGFGMQSGFSMQSGFGMVTKYGSVRFHPVGNRSVGRAQLDSPDQAVTGKIY